MHANALLRGSPLARRTHAPARGPVTDEDRKTLGRPLARTAAQHALAGNQGTDAMAQHTHLAEALATLDALVAAVGPAVAALLLAEQVPSWPGLATWRLGLTRGVAATERAVGLVCPALVPATPWTGTPTRPGDTVRPTHYLKPSALRPAADDPVEGPLVLVQAVARLPGAGACAGGPGADALDAALRSVALPTDGTWVSRSARVVRVRGTGSAPCETYAVGLWRLPLGLDAPTARAALTRLDGAVLRALPALPSAAGVVPRWDVTYLAYDPALHGALTAWATGTAAATRTRDAFPGVTDAPELPLRLDTSWSADAPLPYLLVHARDSSALQISVPTYTDIARALSGIRTASRRGTGRFLGRPRVTRTATLGEMFRTHVASLWRAPDGTTVAELEAFRSALQRDAQAALDGIVTLSRWDVEVVPYVPGINGPVAWWACEGEHTATACASVTRTAEELPILFGRLDPTENPIGPTTRDTRPTSPGEGLPQAGSALAGLAKTGAVIAGLVLLLVFAPEIKAGARAITGRA